MRLSEEKITRGNAVAVKAAVLMSWVRTLQSLQRTPEIRCVPEKMLSLMRLYGVNDLLAPYFK